MDETGGERVDIETAAGLLEARPASGGRISVDMGKARLDWRDIPLANAQDTLHVDLALGPLADPGCTNIGNPHATFFAAHPAGVELAPPRPALPHPRRFPARRDSSRPEDPPRA